ncbi:MAG: iron-sulfur cluster biosynthesis family protein [Cyanobacteria bacterium P01_F01_bin.153]
MVKFSSAAIAEIQRWSRAQEKSDSVKNWTVILKKVGGSCHQWAYDLQLSPSLEEVIAPNTTEALDQGLNLSVPDGDQEWCRDLTVDYSEDLIGGGFRFVNPQVARTCSCGVCFDLD